MSARPAPIVSSRSACTAIPVASRPYGISFTSRRTARSGPSKERGNDDRCGHSLASDPHRRFAMLYYALMFLIVGLIAGALGIYGVAAIASQIAWVLFLIGIVLLVIHLVAGSRPRSTV